MTSSRFERARLQPRRETSSQAWALAPEGRGLAQFLFPILHRRVPHPCLSAFWRDRVGILTPNDNRTDPAFGKNAKGRATPAKGNVAKRFSQQACQ